jgi:hypothetical protein
MAVERNFDLTVCSKPNHVGRAGLSGIAVQNRHFRSFENGFPPQVER